MYEELEKMCETLQRALKETNQKVETGGGKLSESDLAYVDKLTHSIKSVKTTMAMLESYEYSNARGGNSNRGGYSGRMYYDDGTNYRRDGWYSMHGGNLANRLYDMMQDSPEYLKEDIRQLINKVEKY